VGVDIALKAIGFLLPAPAPLPGAPQRHFLLKEQSRIPLAEKS